MRSGVRKSELRRREGYLQDMDVSRFLGYPVGLYTYDIQSKYIKP